MPFPTTLRGVRKGIRLVNTQRYAATLTLPRIKGLQGCKREGFFKMLLSKQCADFRACICLKEKKISSSHWLPEKEFSTLHLFIF